MWHDGMITQRPPSDASGDRPTPTRRPRTRALAAALTGMAALLLAAACAPGGDEPDSPAPTADLDQFYDQELAFESCDGYGTNALHQDAIDEAVAAAGAECARLDVPLDYEDPDGETAQIALVRVPARGDDPIGSLLYNPGGPGGAGIFTGAQSALQLAESPITESFDVIGFDPRGVGASTPAIECHTDAESDDGSYPLSVIGNSVEMTEEDTRAIYERCAQESGGERVLAAVGTRDAARDMDVLREVLGDDQLSFLGQSYGTRLGAVYAEQFPENVRAMVLDGGIDPTAATYERRVAAYSGFQRAFDEMAAFCVAQGDCPLGDDPEQALATFQGIVQPLRENPVPAGPADEFELDFDDATGGVTGGLYISEAWPAIIAGIAEIQQGRGDTLTGINFAFGQRDPAGVWPNAFEAIYAVNCMDEERMSPEEVADLRAEIYASAPYLDPGVDIGAGARDTCEAWPEQPELGFPYADGLVDELPATLVVSITGDATTPYEGGVALAETLGSNLLTVVGEQHTVVTQGNQPCVDQVVADYLVDLRVPEEGATCELVTP